MKTLALAGVVAAAALVPLYGDPRQAPVTHAEWARLLLRAMEMDDVVRTSGQASQVFSTLSWKNSLSFDATRYVRADNVRRLEGGVGVEAVEAPVAELTYPVGVVRGGDYRLRLRLKGNPAAPASVEVAPVGEVAAAKAFSVIPAAISGWVDAGTTHLDPGAYMARVLIAPGTVLEAVEVSPPCLSVIEPPNGWRATAVAQVSDVAVTAIKAMDRESELPPAGTPIEVTGAHFQAVSGPAVTRASAGSLDALWLRAGAEGVQAVVFVDVPEAGLYTVSTFGVQAGQSWLADACLKSVVCAERTASSEPEWRVLMTTELTAGRHFFTVTLANGAAVERLRLERRKNGPADYVAALKRLGFDPGPDGPITRAKAIEAMTFVAGKRSEAPANECGDITLPDGGVLAADAGLPGPGTIPGPALAPPTVGQPPLGPPPVLPSQPPASPTQP